MQSHDHPVRLDPDRIDGRASRICADSSGAGRAAIPIWANRKCDSTQRHIAKEQKSLASFDETIAADKKGRETCASKPMCVRYDQAIKAMEARKAQHEARLAKFKSDAENACKPS